jgi:hypothetical protein
VRGQMKAVLSGALRPNPSIERTPYGAAHVER